MTIKEYGSCFELDAFPGKGSWLDQARANGEIIPFRACREALYCIGLISKKNSIKRAILPALSCSSMIQPFVELGLIIDFYPVNDCLEIDQEGLLSVLSDDSVLIVMNYFGINGLKNIDFSRIKARFNNVILVQDCTQHVFNQSLSVPEADYRVESIRKWFPIPDGAVLYSSRKIDGAIYTDLSDAYLKMSLKMMRLKKQYLLNGDPAIKSDYRNLYAKCGSFLKGKIKPACMSEESDHILCALDIQNCLNRRKTNYERLVAVLREYDENLVRFCNAESSPLCVPIVVDSQERVQCLLAHQGIFCQVLWPISKEAARRCSFSSWFASHMLAIPCDQRYTVRDMDYIAVKIIDVLSREQV